MTTRNDIHNVTIILRSCLTGRPVWIYQGRSGHAAWMAYWRARRNEVGRFRAWGEKASRRKANIRRLLSDCMERIAEMTPEQETAARQLASCADRQPQFYREFYDHVMEERRLDAEDRRLHKRVLCRIFSGNSDYGKHRGRRW